MSGGNHQEPVAIVTGGAAGIGQATVARFARDGWSVAVFDVDRAGGEAVVQELEAAGCPATFHAVNVADAAAVEAAVAAVAERFGGIDVLVNNAGLVRDAQLVKWRDSAVIGRMEEGDFQTVLDVNLKGAFLCGRAVTPHLIARGGGSILNASSVSGVYGNFGQTSYAAAKAAVIAMTRTWARELGGHGIRVNAVAPGFIDTQMLQAVPEKLRKLAPAHTPLGRFGRPEEVAEAYFWLASSAASYVTGAVLNVDGGMVLGT